MKKTMELNTKTGVGITWRFRVCDKGMKEEDKPEWGPEHPNLMLKRVDAILLAGNDAFASFLRPYNSGTWLRSGTGTTPNATDFDGTYQQTGTTVTRATGTGTFVAGNVGDFIKFSTGETAKILTVTSTVEVEVHRSQTVAATTIAVFDYSRTALDNEHNSNQSDTEISADAYDAVTGTATFRKNMKSAAVAAPVTYTEFGWSTTDTFAGAELISRIVLDEGVNLEVDQFLEAQIAMRVTTTNLKTETPLTLDITGWPYEYAIQSITSDGTNWDVVVTPDCDAHYEVGGTINIAGAAEAGYNGEHTIASFPAADTIRITNATNLTNAGAGGTVKNNLDATGIITGASVKEDPELNFQASRRGLLDFGSYADGIRSIYGSETIAAPREHGASPPGGSFSLGGHVEAASCNYDQDAMMETLVWKVGSDSLNLQRIRQLRVSAEDGGFYITFDQPQRKDVGFVLTLTWKHFWEPELNDLEIG